MKTKEIAEKLNIDLGKVRMAIKTLGLPLSVGRNGNEYSAKDVAKIESELKKKSKKKEKDVSKKVEKKIKSKKPSEVKKTVEDSKKQNQILPEPPDLINVDVSDDDEDDPLDEFDDMVGKNDEEEEE